MQKILLALCLFMTTLPAFAITGYADGDELYVLALSGLKLRDKPHGDKVVATINYGDKLLVTGKPTQDYSFESEGIKGYWIKVTFGSKTGFVFDGFLSRYPAPEKSAKGLDDYATKSFKAMTKKTITGVSNCFEQGTSTNYAQFFQAKTGTVVVVEGDYYEGWTYELTLPSCTLEEGWLIARALFKVDLENCVARLGEADPPKDENGNPIPVAHYQTFWKLEGEDKSCILLDMLPDGCADQLTITEREGVVTISRSGGC